MLTFLIDHFGYWILGGVILAIFFVIGKVAGRATKEAILRIKKGTAEENTLELIERMVRIAIIVIGIAVAASINNIHFGAIIASGGVAIALAFQNLIEDYLSGVMLLLQPNIRIGNTMNMNGILAKVADIGMRVTVLQGLDGTMLVVPNKIMLKTNTTNCTINPFRRLDLLVNVGYGADLAKATSLIQAVLQKTKNVLPNPAPSVIIEAFGASAISLHAYCWIQSSQSPLQVKSHATFLIKQAFDAAGIHMPFPIRTLKVDQEDKSLLKTMNGGFTLPARS